MQARGLLLLSACSAAALAVLIGLGLWQLQRLQWKEGLIAQIEARVKAEPVSLKEAVARAGAGEDVSYLRVRTEGLFDNAKERYLFAVSDGTPGWHVIAPLRTADGEVVLVDRGFVPDALKDPAARPQGEPRGAVLVTALARPAEPQGLFVPDNEVERNHWFWRDLKAMTRSMLGGDAKEVAPFFLEAEKSDVPGGWPRGGETRLDLPNNHLQYALTWFALALCLVVIYVVYVRTRLKAA
ncbi:SURF1 family protein [Methyloceanibacter sp.]|uniref:SURF1 family protein n=1 Tax=Methyloceanibacter sp. TaxID=1965321 RepID=UPI003D6D2DCF